MTNVRHGFDLLLALVGAAAWAFFAFVIGSRLFSHTAGGLLAFALFLSALADVLGWDLQDRRMQRLAAGVCPRCRAPIRTEHRHRRWDATSIGWLPPTTLWDCAGCGYSHGESWSCPTCPSE